MEAGEKYWTVNDICIDVSDYTDFTETKIREFSDEELVREWVYGKCQVFDRLVAERTIVYSSKEFALDVARQKLYGLVKLAEDE